MFETVFMDVMSVLEQARQIVYDSTPVLGMDVIEEYKFGLELLVAVYFEFGLLILDSHYIRA